MVKFHSALRIAVVSVFLGGTLFAEARSQETNDPRSNTLVDIARAFANTINVSTVKSRGAALDFDSAIAHDNVVEVMYVANDFAAFDRFKSNSNTARAALIGFYCEASRVAYLQQGLVIHQTYARSDNKDRVEFTIDRSSCDTR